SSQGTILLRTGLQGRLRGFRRGPDCLREQLACHGPGRELFRTIEHHPWLLQSSSHAPFGQQERRTHRKKALPGKCGQILRA
ncbi:MAG: hypothetical protein QNL65_05760, partial [Opitutales bacterium]